MKKLYRIVLLAILLLSNLSLWAQKADDYRAAANKGDKVAQFMLGSCYYVGSGVAQDYKQAVYWYTKAAGQGFAGAQFGLGVCYMRGDGVAQDYKQAVYWYTKAANQGFAEAQFMLGSCYYEGIGVAQDYKQAVYWYTKAADQGLADAQHNLGRCYEKGNGVEKNINKAIEWYTKAAEKGYVDSQYKLGEMYYDGEKVEKDLTKAIYWYSKAAEHGHENALPRLGYCYEKVMTASPKDKTIESLQTICPIEIKVKGLKGDRDKADYTKPMTVVFKPGYFKTGVKETADIIVMEMQLYNDENKLICDEFFTNVSIDIDNDVDEIVLYLESAYYIISVDLNHPNTIDIYEYDWDWWYYDYLDDDYSDWYYAYSIKTNDLSWVDYLANWAYYNSCYSCIEADAEIKSDVMNTLKKVAEKFPNGITTQRKKELPTFNQLQKRIETNFGISNYFDPVTKDELTGKTTSAKSSQTTINPSNNSTSNSSSSSSSTSGYKGKYSRWPYYYSNPIYGFRLGYVQRSLRVSGYDLDEPVHIDMFGEENDIIPGFQLGFLFDPSDWLNMGMFGLNMGVNFEMFFNKWDAAPSNHYDKYMEMNLNFPLDLTFHIPFSSESALYLHGGLAIDWGIYNRLTYSRNSNIEPLTDVFCKHWIDNLNLSYEYGVDLRMKAVMLSLNYQKGFYGHPVFENYTTTIDKLSLGLSFVF